MKRIWNLKSFLTVNFSTYSGHFIFLILFFLSIFFVFERTLYADSAYFVFNIINDEFFFVAADRFGSLFPQLLVIVSVKLGCSLEVILYVFSVSYILFYYLIYNIVVYGLKNVNAGLLIALSLLFCTQRSFFMAGYDINLAVIFSVLFYAFLEWYYSKKSIALVCFGSISILIILLAFFTHPVIVFSLLFIIAFVIIDRGLFKNYELYLFFGFVLISAYTKTLFIEEDSYEGGFITQTGNFVECVKNFRSLYSTVFFISRLSSLYLFIAVISFFVFCYYLLKKEYLKFLLVFFSASCYLIVVNIVFYKGDSDMMMERVYMQLMIIVLIPFFKDFYAKNHYPGYLNFLLLLMILVSTERIVNAGQIYRKRVEYVAGIIEHYKNEKQAKYILDKENLNNDLILVPWAFAIETLLYSSLNGIEGSKTFYLSDNPATIDYDKKDKAIFLAVPFWQNWNTNKLNESYFYLPKQTYVIIK